MRVPVEWTGEDGGPERGELTDELPGPSGSLPVVVRDDGRAFTPDDLRGVPLTAAGPRAAAAEELVRAASEGGYEIGW
jgi:hypothetical protein